MDPALTSSASLDGQNKGFTSTFKRGSEGLPSGPRHVFSRALQFLSSAILFQSFFLLVFAPVPLVWVHLARGRLQALLASLFCGALVFILSGWAGFGGYFVFSVGTAWVIAELVLFLAALKKRPKVGSHQRLVELLLGSAFGVLVLFFVAVVVWAKTSHVSPWQEFEKVLDWLGAEMLRQSPPGSLDAADWAGLKAEWLRNFPSSLVVGTLLQCWVALVVILRLNPSRIREGLGLPFSFYRIWRTPDFFVWPTILLGFGAVFSSGPLEDWCWNGVKIFLSLYCLQGLAILSGIFDLWKLRGFIRTLVFFMVLALMLPLVLGLGFFDLWFDFRAKLRQSQ